MVHIGVFIRTATGQLGEVVERLREICAVEAFELDTPGALGAVFEAPSLEAAEARLTQDIQTMDGVLSAWPIHASLDEPSEVTADPASPHTPWRE